VRPRAPSLHEAGDFELESGEVLRGVVQAYHLDASPRSAPDETVLLFHPLTGSADARDGWWSSVVGTGRTLDPERHPVLCANLLGSCYGTTWRQSDAAAPRITPRDQARLVQRLVEHLGIRSVALAAGGSLGGMVAMEWAVQNPDAARAVAVFAAPAVPSAQALALNHVQRRMVRAGGAEGIEVARALAMLTYRTPAELQQRFGRRAGAAGEWAVGDYLDHHGRALRRRFSARAYLALTHAMDAHDVGRGRGGVAAALRRVRARLIGVGIPGDRLYEDHEVREWVVAAGAEYREIRSLHGHDGFLLEAEAVSRILAEALAPVPHAAGGLR
jgi:homoserine O-acetyltransferase/O-succinyltransferase